MKFGKTIQQQQLPGWAPYYINYKALKKVISSLGKQSQKSNLSTIPLQQSPTEDSDESAQYLRSEKATFFFKLERELEKVNAFYLQKEAELRVRLRSLVDKKVLLQRRVGKPQKNSASVIALQQAFQQFIKDLNKLQQFVELNATGFRKILKKWDKRSKSNTKELYLSRQVEKTPCFDREVITELADSAAGNLLELENLSDTVAPEENIDGDPKKLTFQVDNREDEQLDELETDLIRLIIGNSETELQGVLEQLKRTSSPETFDRLSRVFVRCMAEAPDAALDQVIATGLVDFGHVEDINERTCLHEAAMAGRLKYVKIAIQHKVAPDAVDVGGRTPLHYACMNGHSDCAEFLLSAGHGLNVLDHDNSTPLIYAVTNGQTKCASALLNAGAVVTPQNEGDYIPLALACQYGHLEIAKLLIAKGALKQYDQDAALSPLHLAAREGHADLCELLTKSDSTLLEKVDKDSGWTAIFYAASEGHVACVKVLTAAGAHFNILDESKHSVLYYSAWEGHTECIQVLQAAGAKLTIDSPTPIPATEGLKPLSTSPNIPLDDLDVDTIPSLSLPPPIIPFRIYGHNYLEKKDYMQLVLGHKFGEARPPVKLYGQGAQLSSLKMVISSKHDLNAIPHSIILPLADDREIFSFQLDSLDNFLLEFDIYPTFGSKIIGKAVALPHFFDVSSRLGRGSNVTGNGGFCTLPLLDGHLNVVGEIAFEYAAVKPFSGVQLQVGGRVETYWKSTNTIKPSSTGPTLSPGSVPSFVTASSLTGDHIHLKVQVTKDGTAVVYPDWLISHADFQVTVSDVTMEQFAAFTKGAAPATSATGDHPSEASFVAASSHKALRQVLESLPSSIGVHLEILYPRRSTLHSTEFAQLDINRFVDIILHDVYQHANSSKGPDDRKDKNRSIVFSSFNPAICTALNWKQPNYAVFFNSFCGLQRDHNLLTEDKRSSSIKEAVKFAKANNLLGINLEATLLVQVPSLIQSIKESGLLLTTFGEANMIPRNRQIQEQYGVDATMNQSVIRYGGR